jgi:NTE family protein
VASVSTRDTIRKLTSVPPSGRGRSHARPKVGLVLGGGAARGAYEAGVLRYVCHDLARETGVSPWFDVASGTSVGAVHACFVAATADVLADSTRLLVERWSELELDRVVRFSPRELARFAWSALGGAPEHDPEELGPPRRRGGVIDSRALERFVLGSVPWSRIRANLDSRVIDALTVTATHVASGDTVVFVDTRRPLPRWSADPHVRAQPAHVGPWHALASAAIPMLFPAMPLGGSFYVDGGLRQNTPLSPALRLGVDRVLVISLRWAPSPTDVARLSIVGREREEALPSPLFLAGKTLNALLIDRIDHDLDRLRRTNAVIRAGAMTYGDDFQARLNGVLHQEGWTQMREVRDLLVRPSVDLGELAAHYARSEEFERAASGLAGKLVRRLAGSEASDEADLLSYLLFDGGFAKRLVDLGWQDARARRDEIAAFFE